MSLFHYGEAPYLFKAKSINLWGMRAQAFAISNNIIAKLDFWYLASFRACQITDRSSQKPGIFYIQPFCIEVLINLLLRIKSVSRCLETKLQKTKLFFSKVFSLLRKGFILNSFFALLMSQQCLRVFSASRRDRILQLVLRSN